MDGPMAGAKRGKGASQLWMRALEKIAPIAAHPNRLFANVIDEFAAAQGDAPALHSERENFSYRALAANQSICALGACAGLAKGDVVCLLMPNRPEYLAIWLGVTRVGGVVSLLNTNLTGASLVHCVKIAEPKHIVVAWELSDALEGVRAQLPSGLQVWTHGAGGRSGKDIESDLVRHSGASLSNVELREVSIEDRALLIYTSGTTGLPKAAAVSHQRIMNWSFWFAGMMDTRPNDRMYNCLPLYHSVGGVVAVGSAQPTAARW